ncbi:MAG: tetratricopeptide repeat protein [Planctomycetes bacterium]|nr:tetratricopeptide repeat protein [Planctomycetota bacterium]
MRTARFVLLGLCICVLSGCKPGKIVDNLKPSEKPVQVSDDRTPVKRDLMSKVSRGARLSLEEQNRLQGAKMNNSMGEEAFRNQQYEIALQRFNLAIQQVPDYVDAINNLGRTYYVMQMFDVSLASYQHAQDVAAVIEPDNTEIQAVLHANIGDVYRQRQEYTKALEEYHLVIQLAPHSARAQYEIGNLYLKQAITQYPATDRIHNQAWKERTLRNAIKQFDKALYMDGSLSHAIKARAITYTVLKEYNNAWTDIEELEKLNFEVNPDLKKKVLEGLERERKAQQFRPGT